MVAKQVPATHEQSLLDPLKRLHLKIPAFPFNLECYGGGRSSRGYSCPMPIFFGYWASPSNILFISFSLGQTVTMSSLDPLWANGSYPRSPPFLLEVVQLVCLGGLKVLWAMSSYADVSLKRNVSVLMQFKKKKTQKKTQKRKKCKGDDNPCICMHRTHKVRYFHQFFTVN